MGLSDIKFKYSDKIEKLDKRIEKYSEIIKDYENTISKAEKEENPNVCSVYNAKEKYEHKIKNMVHIKGYYQEFVDTSDYLLQHLNDKNSSRLLEECNHLKHEKGALNKQNDKLEQEIYSLKEQIDKEQILEDLDKKRIKELKNKIRDLKKENQEFKKEINSLNRQIDKKNKEIDNLSEKLTNLGLQGDIKLLNKEIETMAETIQQKNREIRILHERLNWQPKTKNIFEELLEERV